MYADAATLAYKAADNRSPTSLKNANPKRAAARHIQHNDAFFENDNATTLHERVDSFVESFAAHREERVSGRVLFVPLRRRSLLVHSGFLFCASFLADECELKACFQNRQPLFRHSQP